MSTQYVRVKVRLPHKVETIWAQKLAPRHYRKVNTEGEWGGNGKDVRFIVAESDIIFEKPAALNKKYATLELS